MYTVYLIDKDKYRHLLYTPEFVTGGGCSLIDPELKLELNTSGTFTATIPKEHEQYDNISIMLSRIVVFDGRMSDDNVLWRGRVISVERDFWGNKQITAEGELSYFADYLEKSFTRYGAKAEAQDYVWTGTVAMFWDALISHYNEAVAGNDSFHPMYIPHKDESGQPMYEIDPELADRRIAIENRSFTNGLDMIMKELIEQVGGYVWFSWSLYDGTRPRILHHTLNSGDMLEQQIRFGVNLLDITPYIDGAAIYTSIVAEGPNDPDGIPYTLDRYSPPDAGYSISGYGLCRDDAVRMFGKIEHYEKFDSAVNYHDLYRMAKAKLDGALAESMSISVKAVDLHYIDQSKERFRLGSSITCVSEPHGLNDQFILSAMRIPLDRPEAEEYTLGIADAMLSAKEQLNMAKVEQLQKSALTVKSANKIEGQISPNQTKTGYINIGDEMVLAYGYVKTQTVKQQKSYSIDFSGAGFAKAPVLTVNPCCTARGSSGTTISSHITAINSQGASISVLKTVAQPTVEAGLMWIAVGYPKAVRE